MMVGEIGSRPVGSLSTPSKKQRYRIVLCGALDPSWLAAFDPLSFRSQSGQTHIEVLADQSALRAVLNHLWDLNQVLLSAEALTTAKQPNGGN